jgi:hypothetical protein
MLISSLLLGQNIFISRENFKNQGKYILGLKLLEVWRKLKCDGFKNILFRLI